MATIKDVAQRAGVSVATVSRVLSGYDHVSEDVRRRVLDSVVQLDYRIDEVARSLRRRRTNLIALVVSLIDTVFFTEIARGAEAEAQERGYTLILSNSNESVEQETRHLAALRQQMVAGMIVAPAPGRGDRFARLIKHGIPVVLVNRHLDDVPLSSVVSNEEEISYECVSYLIRSGRRRIAAVTGFPDVSTTRERLSGYVRAHRAAGLLIDPTLEVCGHATLEGGYRATVELLQRPDPPDALFVFAELMVQGAVMALQDRGISWPDPIDVAGFGAFEHARLYRPPLNLIDQPAREMGRAAVSLLIDQIDSPGDPGEPRTARRVVLRNRLVTREAWLKTSSLERPA